MDKLISEIKRIVKSNTNKNKYTKNSSLSIKDDELARLTSLIQCLETEINNQ